MIFLVVLGLTAVLGVKSEYNCTAGPPPCMKDFEQSIDDPFREYLESGKPLPSNKVITALCPPVLGIMECIREEDALHCITSNEQEPDIDYVALYNSVTEFCNEESEVRRGYVAHVDCVNNITSPDDSCVTELGEMAEKLGDEEKEALEKMEISDLCLSLGVIKVCATEIIEEHCGKDAGQTGNAIMSGIENIVRCGGSDVEEAIALLMSKFNSVI